MVSREGWEREVRLWGWELEKENPERSRIKHSLCYLNLVFVFNGVITGTAQPELPGSTLPVLRNLDVFHSLHLDNRAQGKKPQGWITFSLHSQDLNLIYNKRMTKKPMYTQTHTFMYLHTHVHVCINPDSHGISPHSAVRFSSQIYVLSLQSHKKLPSGIYFFFLTQDDYLFSAI